MRRSVKRDVELGLRKGAPGEGQLRLLVKQAAVPEFCLSLSALRYGLVSEVELEQPGLPARVAVSFSPKSKTDRVELSGDAGITVTLTQHSLDYVMVFYLRYHLSGEADVDHVDLQTSFGYVTFFADKSRKPYSPDEAAALMR